MNIFFVLISVATAMHASESQQPLGAQTFPLPLWSKTAPLWAETPALATCPDGKQVGTPLADASFVTVPGSEVVLVPMEGGMNIAPYEGTKGGLLVNAFPPPIENVPLTADYNTNFGTAEACQDRSTTAMDRLYEDLQALNGKITPTLVLYEGCCEKTYAISWSDSNMPEGVSSDNIEFTKWMEKTSDMLLTKYAQDAIMMYDNQGPGPGNNCLAPVADGKHSYLLFNKKSTHAHHRMTTCRVAEQQVDEAGWSNQPIYVYPRTGAITEDRFKEKTSGCDKTCAQIKAESGIA